MLRIYYKKMGAHYHMRVFFHGKMGDLCVDEDSWPFFRSLFNEHVEWIDGDRPVSKQPEESHGY